MNLKFARNLCDQLIHDRSVVHEVIEARVVLGEGGMPRLIDRGEVLSLNLCRSCARQLRGLMTTIRKRTDQAKKSA